MNCMQSSAYTALLLFIPQLSYYKPVFPLIPAAVLLPSAGRRKRKPFFHNGFYTAFRIGFGEGNTEVS